MSAMRCSGARTPVTTQIARGLLVVALLTIAGLKAPVLMRSHTYGLASLGDLLRGNGATATSMVVEAGLALAVAGRHWRIGVRGVHWWVAVLTGVMIAAVVTGTQLSSCGCLGTASVGTWVRILVLAGLALTAWVARADPGDGNAAARFDGR